MTKQGLETFFEPKSVAVIGASRTPGKLGYNTIQNLLNIGNYKVDFAMSTSGAVVDDLHMSMG